MTASEIIKKKRDKTPLTFDEIKSFINGAVSGAIPDYQISALLMAIFLNGMTDEETSNLTKVMASSGRTLNLDMFGGFAVDKHSTGGVGDKTTLVVAPIAASLGCKVAKMSGRGLGFTGGTVDKLSSIPGYNITPDFDTFISIVKNVGVSVVGQSESFAPADKKLYALRDVTATVDSIPLIASSVMSKKIATGSNSIVLDVKFGSGAFMKTPERACELAEKMVSIGKNCGKKVAAVITDMSKPLGFAIGNTLEVIEAVNFLKGAIIPDLYDECVVIAANMVSLSKNIPFDTAVIRVKESISSGAAYAKFLEWISAQGGDVSYIENTGKFPAAAHRFEVLAENSGYIVEMETEKIGNCAGILGAGRMTADDIIDHCAGITLDKKTGDCVKTGDRLCTIYTNDAGKIADAEKIYLSAVKIGGTLPQKIPTVYKTIL